MLFSMTTRNSGKMATSSAKMVTSANHASHRARASAITSAAGNGTYITQKKQEVREKVLILALHLREPWWSGSLFLCNGNLGQLRNIAPEGAL